ncbi:uncharacterized protein THITE_2106203 [Thermothielavioides terrestris NRRL 8126]|uniref:Flo11 n=1 Tax=Thermothielavioides terrestris (strain ATCC 38088 / NRRL 8126) TaxID=578455 RepID=G2QWN5_THETT|nr:uncharacterized protein THITE_2106203 [Thermothielavioides terrestris NRRL 8126]AEO62245.1 hypothetical protein THITE_2106203 [Thermothielavioides terrestris NRRL 8126]
MVPSPLDPAVSQPSSAVPSTPHRMPSRSRTQSISSDRPSTVAHSLMSPPLSVSPEPAFIAASAASQIVTNDHDSHAETWYDQHGIEPSGETAAVSPAALQLVNSFLDQLLFNFLSVSRSTSLHALRPAVSEVLKPKLAKDAINQADEELREYLGGDDEDATLAHARDPVPSNNWDLELAWKRTRLRCMVYSSLGDMEEEDEDYYMEQGHLDTGLDDRFSEAVSPAVAIFLTSILEFMGEQALIVAGQAAYHRMRSKYEKDLKDGVRSPTGVAERIVVEDLDMERVALDRTLGRLWRSWKKKIRSPAVGSADRLNRSYSRDSLRSATGHLRSPSTAAEPAVPATVPEPHAEIEQGESDAQKQIEDSREPLEEHLVAAAVPLPIGPNDIAEIEVPGLALYNEGESADDGTADVNEPARPKSMMILPSSGMPELHATPAPSRPLVARKRSSSLPAPTLSRYVTAAKTQHDERSTVGLAGDPAAEGPEGLGAAADAPAGTVVAYEAGEPGARAGPDEYATEDEEMKEDVDDEVSIEEPRIVRSSRVSILGHSPSTGSSEHGRPASINTNLPVRTPSIHSARLIDVAGPRSPAVGSRRNSVAVAESIRQSSPPRTSRTVTPPAQEDRPVQPPDSASGGRLSVSVPNRSGLAASASISEAEEAADKEYVVSPAIPVSPAAPPPVAKDRHEPAGAALQDRIPERSIPAKPTTKVTVLPAMSSPVSTASSTNGTFFIESMPVLPEGREIPEPPRADSLRSRSSAAAQPPPPAVPDRSAGRQAVANTSALRQPATIGQVSVERSRPRSPSQGSSSRPRDPSAGRSKQQHASGSPSSTKFKPVRTSEDGMQARIDMARNFEELIQSDQTIQYTLTPENMRELDPQSQPSRSVAGGSPVVSVKTRKSEEARQNGSRSRSSSVHRNDARPSTSATRSSGSPTHPVTDGHQSNKNFPAAAGKHGGVVPRSIPPMPSKPRAANGPQARDARLGRESLAEFAEFIRSTGPAGGSAAATLNASPGVGRTRHPGSVSNVSIETGRTSTTSNPNRPKLQARGAAVDYKDDNSDLIDFIRRGPPSAPGNHRIPRAVAPFRTTMDSDQMSNAVGGKAVDAQLRDVDMRSSQASTNATESSVPPSIQSSVNSHSALLTRNKPPTSYDAAEVDMPMPKRKTRRVRDPYAIDISDEELEEDEEPVPVPVQNRRKRAQTQEESLIDFLNNYAPPPEPTVQPFNTAQTRNMLKPKKKASAPSLMARFTRRDSGQLGNGGSTGPASPDVPQPPAASRSLSSQASSGGKAGHIPIQVNIPGGDVYSPPLRTSSRSAASTMTGSSGAVGGRVPMKKFVPREPVSVTNRGTSDLAEFLKHSGPPAGAASMGNQLPGLAERDEANGLSKVFTRRKRPSIS